MPRDSRQSHATSATKELFRERYSAMCLQALDVRPDARKRSIKKFKDRLWFLKNVASVKKCGKENYKTLPSLSFFPNALRSNSANYSQFGVSKRRQVVCIFISAYICELLSKFQLRKLGILFYIFNLVQRMEDGIRDIRPWSEAALLILKRHGETSSVALKSPCMEQREILSKNFDLLRVSLVFCPISCVTSDK